MAFVRTNAQTNEVELQEVPVPTFNSNELLVKVEAFGVGVHDRYFIPPNVNFPYPIGTEGAGIIVDEGSDVADFHKGERVILSSSMQMKGGSWAQYVVATAEKMVRMPDPMTFEEGAILPIAGKTAMESMHALGLHEGNTLFVAGATGAIGTLILQLAKNQGIRTIGSSSSKNHEYMYSLGVEMAVDYSDPNWKEKVRQWKLGGVDAALAIQSETTKDCMDVVKDEGTVLTVSGDQVTPERRILIKQFQHELNLQWAIEELISGYTNGEVQLMIERIYPFKEALDALVKSETKHVRGKLVVSMKNI